MSLAKEQARREYIQDFLTAHGMPDPGTIHDVRKGNEANYENRPIDVAFEPASAVIVLTHKGGRACDGKYYDKQGYQVYSE